MQAHTPAWPCTLAAWTAATVGFLMVIGSTGHLVGVLAVASADHKPFDFRLVSLITMGGVMLYPGLLDLGVAWWIGRGRPWAFAMSGFGTIALLSFMTLWLFMDSPADSQNPLGGSKLLMDSAVVMNGALLIVLSAVWIVRMKREAVGDGT